MKKDREFENILDECLEKMLRGTPIEQCLADYPDHAAALEPMLRTAFRAKTAADIRPSPEFKDRARHQFQVAIRETAPAPARVRRGFFPSLRPAWVALAALVAVIIAGGGTVYAAGNALPDSPLYAVKLATESVRLFLTPSDIGKAELYAQFADERIEEIIEMADKGEAELAEKATDRLNTQLVAIAGLTIGDEGTATGGDTFALEAADSSRYGGEEEASVEVTVPQTNVAAVAPTTAPAPGTPITTEPAAALATAPDKTWTQDTADIAPESVPEPITVVSPLTDIREAENYSLSADDLEREKLKELLLRRAIENPDALRAALETAPESLKEILRWAIEVADAGYDEAISNLR